MPQFVSRPHLPVEHPVVDGFVDVAGGDAFAVVEVGDGPGDPEDFVVSSGGEAEVVDAVLEQVLAVLRQLAEVAATSTRRPRGRRFS